MQIDVKIISILLGRPGAVVVYNLLIIIDKKLLYQMAHFSNINNSIMGPFALVIFMSD